MEAITIFTSGVARGNPGPAAVGVYILDSKGNVLAEVSEKIGNANSDFAGYHAVMRGLQIAKEYFGDATTDHHFEIKLDSELVKKQLNNEYQINEPGLVPYFIEIHNLRVSSFPALILTLISQESNTEASRLVNEALGPE